jgi:4-hydroxy-4-methyl-2-oxoglutarate aldolase
MTDHEVNSTESGNGLITRRAALAGASGAGLAAMAMGVAENLASAAPPAANSRPGPKATNYKVIRDFDRPSPDLLAKLKEVVPYCVAVAGPLGLGSHLAIPPGIRPVKPRIKLSGLAFTVTAPDHLMPMYATTLAQPGDILMIAAGGPSDVAIWGGSMTRSALSRKVGGVVIDGMVCDTGALIGGDARWNLPIFCRGSAAAYTTWEKPGSINVPVAINGHVVEPGDYIIADDDGVAVLPKALFLQAIEIAQNFGNDAKMWQDELSKGRTWFDILGLQRTIESLAIPEYSHTREA